MRGAITVFALAWFATSALPAQELPYTATVAGLNVTARSGPTFGAYPTERLPKHSQVEVHQEGESGWVAIRPPREAFGWLPASAVKRKADKKVAEVLADDTPSWIGSNVKKIEKHVSQVKLHSGEKVQILAEKPVKRSDGSTQVWLKIAPPPGEFRWVQAKHLSTKSPEQLASEETTERVAREDRYRRENAENPPGLLARIMQDDRGSASGGRDNDVEPAQFLGRGRVPLLSRNPRSTKPMADDSIEGLRIEKGTPSETLEDETKPESNDEADVASPRRPRISLDPQNLTKSESLPSKGTSSEKRGSATSGPARQAGSASSQQLPIDSAEFQNLLTALEVDLTLMVAGDASKWNLKPLRERAEALVEDGSSPLERGRARLLLDRIAEFESTLPPGYDDPVALPKTAPSTSSDAAAVATKPEFETRYDAVGYLMPVLGSRPDLPPYQLTDKDGNTLQYVSPAPGVNLNRYVKKQVGLYGQRGYLETLKKQHVTAQRVIDLDRHRR